MTRKALSRRSFVKSAGAGIIGAPMVLTGLIRRAHADYKPGVIRFRAAGTTASPKDWSLFEKETGLKMEASVEKDDPGVFYNDVKVNDAGQRFDLYLSLAGVQKTLADGGYVLPIDGSRLKNWAGVSKDVRDMPLLKEKDGKNWGVPIYMNADTFGYFPDELKEPSPPGEVSWSLVFDNEKTKGRVSIDDNYFSLSWAGAYMKAKHLADIKNAANMTPSEVETVANYMIERKKAGQFRNLWNTYDDQVSNFVNHEVLAQRCWEPAVKDARAQGLNVRYASTPEFYIKWMQAAFIPAEAKDRNLDEIYTALDWLLGGGYSASLTPLRGYVTSRPDLGIEYAKEHNLGNEVVQSLEENLYKIKVKFAHPEFWFSGVPDTLAQHNEQMERFKNA
jgi:spermidine/putrescine-binding protein